MAAMRTTLSDVCAFEGPGLHSGVSSKVTLRPLMERSGICFRFGDACYSMTDARRTDARRNTAIVFPNGRELATVEHLLAAAAGVGLDDAVVECGAGELPILDGSALPYAEGILRAGLTEKDVARVTRSLVTPVCIDDGAASIAALPSDALRVTYVIDYPDTPIGTEMKDFTLTREAFLREIAPARTFALLREIEGIRGAGLGIGGTLDNALIVGDDGPVGGAAPRVAREYAAHKVLDLIGDLALLGALPAAHYICVKGGHRLHCKLVNRIQGGCLSG